MENRRDRNGRQDSRQGRKEKQSWKTGEEWMKDRRGRDGTEEKQEWKTGRQGGRKEKQGWKKGEGRDDK
jgi:hypothetical protein